jgi:hypothetical protein
MNTQDAANYILADGNAERQRDLLGNAGTTPPGIPSFHGNHGGDEFSGRSLRARPTPALGAKQHAIFLLAEQTMEAQQSGRFQNDGGTENPGGADEQSTQTGDEPIRNFQIGRAFAAAIEDQQLMPDQHGFGNHGT